MTRQVCYVESDLDRLMEYFLHYEGGGRCAEGLAAHLDAVLDPALKLSSRHLATILYHAAFAAVRKEVYGPAPVAKEVIHDRLERFTDLMAQQRAPEPFTIPHILSAFQILHIQPSQKFLDYCNERGPGAVRRMNLYDLRCMIGAAADLALVFSPDFMTAVKDKAALHGKELKGEGLHNLLHGLAIMDAVHACAQGEQRADFKSAFTALFKFHQLHQLPLYKDEKRQKLLDAYYWFRGADLARYPERCDIKSLFESQVRRDIAHAGARVLPSKYIPAAEKRIDLSAVFDGVRFDIECDGPVHFVDVAASLTVRESGTHIIKLDGSTIFQTMLLGKRDPGNLLVRYPYPLHEEGKDVWKDVLPRIFSASAGAYMITNDGHLGSLLLPVVTRRPNPACT